MPPTKAVKIERIIQRVGNAIHNPVSTVDTLYEAIRSVELAKIPIYKEDINKWVCTAIKNHRCDMILEILGQNQVHPLKMQTAVLKHFILKKRTYLRRFVASSAFQPDWPSHLPMLLKLDPEDPYVEKFFSLPRTGSLLNAIRPALSRTEIKTLVGLNPDLQTKMNRRRILMRFWLLTVKRNLPAWKASLYYPGSGPLYKKALASFKSDLPYFITCL